MRKSKSPKDDELEGMSEYDNTDGNRDTDRDILVEFIVAIIRARRTGINILSSSQPGMQKIMGVKIPFKILFTFENL